MVKKKIDLHFITDPVYKFKINFFYGGTYDQFLDAIEENTGIHTARPTGLTQGCFWSCKEKNMYLLWLPRTVKHGTLGHEIIHLLFTMFEAVGVPTAIQNQETMAYHWEWWFDRVKECTKK